MADCYIEEYANVGSGGGSYFGTPVPPAPAVDVQKIAIGGTSVQSAAFNNRTKMIVIVADGACHFEVGADPTATTSSAYLPANTVRELGVPYGYKIAIRT